MKMEEKLKKIYATEKETTPLYYDKEGSVHFIVMNKNDNSFDKDWIE